MPTNLASQRVEVRPNEAPVGVEILGVDLARELDDAAFEQIRDAYYHHSLLIFRGQDITPEQQIRFTRRFGELQLHHLKQYVIPEHPEILRVSNLVEHGRPIGLADAGRVAVWHTDLSYLKEPVAGSTFYAVEIPHDAQGNALGDTLFAGTFAAYDALPEDLKHKLEGARAIHHMTKGGYEQDVKTSVPRIAYTEEQKKNFVDQAHPIVRRHPVTGRKCLYVNPLCTTDIVGMPSSEGRPLLEFLYAQCTKPEFVYRHKWRKGDLLMWDNAAALHMAIIDYALPQRRVMHRITLKGSVPT
jgi:taurine dioxygenase